MQVYSVRLAAWHAIEARRIGRGDMSKGIRASIEETAERKKTRTEPGLVQLD